MGSINKLLSRSVSTALKLPIAAIWDVVSLGNMGEGSSTRRVLKEHRDQKKVEEILELAKKVKDL